MNEKRIQIGKIMRIQDISILFEITNSELASNVTSDQGFLDYVVGINKYIYSTLPNGKKIIGRITKIYDRNLFALETVYTPGNSKIVAEADLVGIYDDFLKKFDQGINTFPVIGAEVYSVDQEMYRWVLKITPNYLLEIGKSYNDLSLGVYANPDILFGKHLGVFGNTGTGKSCTVASLLQGIKRRLTDANNVSVSVKPKIIIFDSNDEYERAFTTGEYSVRKISKSELKLPHYSLSYTEYYQFLGASQGVQAPVLKASIDKLRADTAIENAQLGRDPRFFEFSKLHSAIEAYIQGVSTGQSYSYNQWYGWNATLLNRISRVVEDKRIYPIISSSENTVEDILNCEEEIVIIEADYDKDEIDIIIFLFSKLLYQWAISNRQTDHSKNILLVFEEAHRYINEEESATYKLGTYYIERLAREGRKFGISLIVSSQRPSELSKTVLSQCNSFIIHRITNKNDLDFINRLVSTQNNNVLQLIPGLERQFAIVLGEAFGNADLIRVDTAGPTPFSDDPKVVQNWNGQFLLS